MRAVQLAGQQIVVIAKILPPLDILAAAGEDSVCCVPQLLGYDGRYDFPALILEHHPLLRREKLLLFGEHIHDADLVADIIALVLRVGNHAGHGRVGDFSAVVVAVAFFPEQVFDLLHAVMVSSVQPEQLAHHGRLGFVNDEPPAVLSVSEDAAVAENNIVFYRLLVAELDAARQLAQLVLRDAGHDGEAQLGVLVERVDVVVLEKNADACGKQLARVADAVECISGETGDLLGEDEVKFVVLRVLHHALKVVALARGHAGKTLVNVAVDERPCRVAGDIVAVVADLVVERVELLVAVGRNARVKRYAQSNVAEPRCAQLLPYRKDVHKPHLKSSLYHD